MPYLPLVGPLRLTADFTVPAALACGTTATAAQSVVATTAAIRRVMLMVVPRFSSCPVSVRAEDLGLEVQVRSEGGGGVGDLEPHGRPRAEGVAGRGALARRVLVLGGGDLDADSRADQGDVRGRVGEVGEVAADPLAADRVEVGPDAAARVGVRVGGRVGRVVGVHREVRVTRSTGRHRRLLERAPPLVVREGETAGVV